MEGLKSYSSIEKIEEDTALLPLVHQGVVASNSKTESESYPWRTAVYSVVVGAALVAAATYASSPSSPATVELAKEQAPGGLGDPAPQSTVSDADTNEGAESTLESTVLDTVGADQIGEARGSRIKRLLKTDAVQGVLLKQETEFLNEAITWSNKNGMDEAITWGVVKELSESLSMDVSNGYGVLAQHTRNLYGYDHVLEPLRTSHLKVVSQVKGASYHWLVRELTADDEDATSLVSSVVTSEHADEITLAIDEPNHWYHVTLIETYKDASSGESKVLRKYSSSKVVSKYVRREIRDLSDEDREAIFGAMQSQYERGFSSLHEAHSNVASVQETGTDSEHPNADNEGGEKKRDVSSDNTMSDITYLALVHNANGWCYHGSTQFLTAHAAMQVVWEQSLRKAGEVLSAESGGKVPRISSTFYWDQTIDAAQYGADWMNSVMYSDDWFGPLNNSKHHDYQMQSGRFKESPIPKFGGDYNNSGIFALDAGMYNQYGLLTEGCVDSTSQIIQRSNDFCGLTNKQELPGMENYVKCMNNFTTLEDIEGCIETNLHGNLHSLNGGAWDCAYDFGELTKENPHLYPETILNFLAVDSFNPWFKFAIEWSWATCVQSVGAESDSWPCDLDDASCGAVTSLMNWTDGSNTTDEEVWEYGAEILTFYSAAHQGGDMIQVFSTDSGFYNETGSAIGWKHLQKTEDQTLFMRMVLQFWSNPGVVGTAATGSSPLDPLFFTWHTVYDKMDHVLLLAEPYEDYDMAWDPDEECNGANWTGTGSHLPVQDVFEDAPKGVHFDNGALWGLLNPDNEHINYIYDKFTDWGTEYWDPCDGTCS